MNIAWWSAGVTSAIAVKKALELYENVKIILIETGSHHPDNERFKKDCENWYNQKIETVQSKLFQNHFDVIEKTRFINSPYGASCTKWLKIQIRKEIESDNKFVLNGQIWGFDFDEINRAERFKENNKDLLMEHYFPLIELKLTKENCLYQLEKAGIEKPKMYSLGYHNNNCIGCVKGGKGYWNKIRIDFPEVFKKMAEIERNLNHSCLKDTFLDELNPRDGHFPTELMPDCGIMCNQQLRLF